jgi:hypothetical protein
MSYDAATDYIERYNAMVDRVNAVSAQSASKAASSLADDANDLTDTATPLGDAQPFEYGADELSGDSMELAGIPFDGAPNTKAAITAGRFPYFPRACSH